MSFKIGDSVVFKTTVGVPHRLSIGDIGIIRSVDTDMTGENTYIVDMDKEDASWFTKDVDMELQFNRINDLVMKLEVSAVSMEVSVDNLLKDFDNNDEITSIVGGFTLLEYKELLETLEENGILDIVSAKLTKLKDVLNK